MSAQAPTSFRQRVAEALRENGGVESGPVAVAASGGVDSTVLLRTLHTLGVELVALHVDHGLRDDAVADADFVVGLAERLGIPCEVLEATVADGNRQHEARRARYAALAQVARRLGCMALATGHTATDQAETVLMHLIRGSGLRGLAGMPVRRPLGDGLELVRPLLWATRAEVEAEATREGWTWREEPSNATDAYRRNRIRHHVLPLLEAEGGPGTVARIAASAAAARAALPDLRAVAVHGDRALDLDVLRGTSDRAAVWTEALAAWAPAVRRTRNLIRQLDGLVDGAVGRHVPVGPLVAWRDREAIRFVEPAKPVDCVLRIGETARTVLGTLELAKVGADALNQTSVLFDAAALEGTLRLRTWRAGDRIAPRGLDGTKLVSDVLTEGRVRPSHRDRQLVLCVDDRVAWVVGHRVAAWAEGGESPERLVRAAWSPRVSVG